MERRIDAAQKKMFDALQPSSQRRCGSADRDGAVVQKSIGDDATVEAVAAGGLEAFDNSSVGSGGACVAGATKQHTDGTSTGVKPN